MATGSITAIPFPTQRLYNPVADRNRVPTVNDDVDGGYVPGSRWMKNDDENNVREWLCWKNDDGDAGWEETTGAGGSVLPVDDATAVVKGSADATKLVRIEADGLTTGTTRVLNMPDQDLSFGTGVATALGVNVGSSGAFLLNTGSANPSASVGLSAVNGSALTFMRSDAAPALDQAITPTWTGKHTYADSATAGIWNVTERSTEPSGPASGDVYLDDGTNTGSGNPGWRRYTGSAWEDITAAAGGGGTPGGSDTQLQYNDGGSAFGGMAGTAWDDTNNTLTITQQTAAQVPVSIVGHATNSVDMHRWTPNGVTAGQRARITLNGNFSNNRGSLQSESFGEGSLINLTSGIRNYAFGYRCLRDNQSGSDNVAFGVSTFFAPTAPSKCLGIGSNVFSNAGLTTATNSIGIGVDIAVSCTSTTQNTFIGVAAGQVLQTGGFNSGIGFQSLKSVTTGQFNVGVGRLSCPDVTTGSSNVGIGNAACDNTTTQSNNIGIGFSSNTAGFSPVMVFGTSTAATANNQFVAGSVTSIMTDVYFGKGVTSTSASNYTIHGTGGSGTDNAGGNVVLAGGISTGSGDPGKVLLQVAIADAGSGTTANGLSTVIEVDADTTNELLGFFGATTVQQQATTGTTTGFTAGSGTGVNDDSTFTGNTGATAYTIGDLVLALKNYGLLAA